MNQGNVTPHPAIRQQANQNNESPLIFQRLADVQPESIDWLWRGCLARGKLTLVGGNPGVGKSQVAASITGIISSGGKFPTNQVPVEAGSVIFVGVEDGLADTLRPRMDAAGADLDKVYILEGKREYKPNGQEVNKLLDVTKDLDDLAWMVEQLGDVRLLIFDPINDYVGNGKQNDNAEMRNALVPLAHFAEKHQIAVLAITHLKKSSGGGDPIDSFISSRAFTGVARCVFAVAKDNEDDNKKLFISVKNNIEKDTGGYSFAVEGCQITGGIDTSRVVWNQTAITKTADEVMRDSFVNPEDKSALDEAVDFLDTLFYEQSTITTKDMEADAKGAGIAPRTLERARKRIGAKSTRDKMNGQHKGAWYWYLPDSIREQRYRGRNT